MLARLFTQTHVEVYNITLNCRRVSRENTIRNSFRYFKRPGGSVVSTVSFRPEIFGSSPSLVNFFFFKLRVPIDVIFFPFFILNRHIGHIDGIK